MTWIPPTEPITSPLKSVASNHVFYEWDCIPLSFATADEAGRLWFVHSMSPVDSAEGHQEQYLAVPITLKQVELLTANRLPILDALQSDAALVLIVDMADLRVIQAWRVKTADVPTDYLPVPGVMLLPDWDRFETPKSWDRMRIATSETKET